MEPSGLLWDSLGSRVWWAYFSLSAQETHGCLQIVFSSRVSAMNSKVGDSKGGRVLALQETDQGFILGTPYSLTPEHHQK